jgi:tRNA (guanosine-2'-O-)-methyltransferase
MKSALRTRADAAKIGRCKNLVVVLENPKTIENIGSTIRNVNALGAEKLYVVDGYNLLPKDWQDMRHRHSLMKISASAVKWTYIKTFPNTSVCLDYLKHKNFTSMVTSPHIKGKTNVTIENGKFTQPRLAVWFGNETHGVSEEIVANCEACINIPMCGIIESLNLGTSTGIVLYEITRQRRKVSASKTSRNVPKYICK